MVGWHESEQDPWDNEEQRSLASCSPWGCEELDMTKQLNNNWTVYFRWVNCMVCKFSQKTVTTHTHKITGKRVKASLERTFVGLPFPKWLDTLRINSSIHVCEWASEYLLSRVSLFATPWTVPTGLLCLSNSPRKNTGVGFHFLLHNTYMIMQKWG